MRELAPAMGAQIQRPLGQEWPDLPTRPQRGSRSSNMGGGVGGAAAGALDPVPLNANPTMTDLGPATPTGP
jgi:hypothetical protein